MFEKMLNVFSKKQLLEIVANKISEQIGRECNHFEMVYSVHKEELKFRIYNDYGHLAQVADFPDGKTISGLLKIEALSHLPEGTEIIYTVASWHRTDENKCTFTIHYEENGKPEKLETKY